MYVGLLSTFLLLWLHPALGEGRGGGRGEGSAADQGGEEGEPGGKVMVRRDKECVRKVMMEERRVPRFSIDKVGVIIIVQGGDQVHPLHPQELPYYLCHR